MNSNTCIRWFYQRCYTRFMMKRNYWYHMENTR